MPIKFKPIEKGQPGIPGGGEKKYYASKINNGEITLRPLAKEVAGSNTVSVADVIAVLESMIEAMPKYLADGKIVRLGEFGSFNIGISSRAEESAEKVSKNSIIGNKIRFTPGKELKGFLTQVDYQKGGN